MKKFQFTFLLGAYLAECLLGRRRARYCLWAFLSTFVLFGSATLSFAQAPGWSRGQQNLAITYDDCMRRAPAALQNEGYRIDYNSGNFAVGIKGVHTAVVICSPAPDAKMLVHIVVASNGEGGGSERQCLQAQMERPGVSRCGGSCQPPDFLNTTFEWLDNGGSLGTINFYRDGTTRVTWINVPHVWRTDSNGDLMVYGGGTRWVVRLRYDATTCTFRGARDRTSQTQDGVNTELRPYRR
jgi:hypothetical protein